VAITDDVATIATGHNTAILENVVKMALSAVAAWMNDNELKISAGKKRSF